MIFGVTLYFLLAAGLLGYAMLPSWRQAVHRTLATIWHRCRQASTWRPARSVPAWRQAGRALAAHRQHWISQLLPSRTALVVALSALLVLPLGVALLRTQWRLDTFDHTRSRPPDAHISALLQGRELVPPLPLPPELFSASDLAVARPLLSQANRDWGLLDPEFRRRLLLLFELMRERHGYDLVLLEGWRSGERQNQLAALGGHVTRATAFESQHQWGRAADVAFLRQGRIVISERDEWALRGYEHYGALATSLGLTWGGHWRSLRDYGHVEWRGGAAAASTPERQATAHPPVSNREHNTMARPVIIVGDPVYHGSRLTGRVITGAPTVDHYGIPISRVSDLAICACSRTPVVIVSGDPTCIMDGKPVARDRDRTSCGGMVRNTQTPTIDHL